MVITITETEEVNDAFNHNEV